MTKKSNYKISRRAFQRALISWFAQSARALPWREETEAYRIWISEMMCQQTAVQTAAPYYLRFVRQFPDVFELAKSKEDEVLKLWEGLGYYSRARNIHKAAKMIVHRFDGRFPDSREEILRLPGIGPYSAGAILAIAFGRREAAVDGNVIRVLSRIFAIDSPVDDSKILKLIWKQASELLPEDPMEMRAYTEALMELGATICQPRKAQCLVCPVKALCRSRDLPAALGRPRKRRRVLRQKLIEWVYFDWRAAKFGVTPKAFDSKYPYFHRLPFQLKKNAPKGGAKLRIKYSVTDRDFEVFVVSRKCPASLASQLIWVSRQQAERLMFPAVDRKIIRALCSAEG